MDGRSAGGGRVDNSERQTLSRERIIATAIAFVDANGLTALTMRQLGKELGVEAMSLYRYVNGREDLLEGMVDHMVAQLQLRPDVTSSGRPTAGRPTCSGWLMACAASPASIPGCFLSSRRGTPRRRGSGRRYGVCGSSKTS